GFRPGRPRVPPPATIPRQDPILQSQGPARVSCGPLRERQNARVVAMNVTAPTCVRETSAEGSSLQPASPDAPTATSTHAAAVLAQAQGTSTYEGILARGFFNLGRRREIDFLDTLERPSEYARRAFLEVAEA